jgi:hypothetical protein
MQHEMDASKSQRSNPTTIGGGYVGHYHQSASRISKEWPSCSVLFCSTSSEIGELIRVQYS